MQTAHLISVGTSEKNLLSLCQRQNALILQQHFALLSSLQRLLCKFIASELLIALTACIGFLKESQTIFGTEDATHGIVDTRHLHLALVHQFLQQNAELHTIGIHRHVDTGIDSDTDGIFLILGHLFAREEVVDIGPVCHKESIPLQVFLQPLGQIFVAGMKRNTID